MLALVTASFDVAIAAEAPGDIPDTQTFVTYRSPAGFSVLFPEGWSRTASGNAVTFSSNFNGEKVVLRTHGDAVTAVRRSFAEAHNLKLVRAGSGDAPAVVTFTAQSKPDEVTRKRIALDYRADVFRRGAADAVLAQWAPVGADNADQWTKVALSFRWK